MTFMRRRQVNALRERPAPPAPMREMVLADIYPATAVDVVEAIVATDAAMRLDDIDTPVAAGDVALTAALTAHAKVPGKGNCPKCGKYFALGLHLHHRACKG